MKTKHRFITMLSSIALCASCAIGVSSAGAQTYSLTDLGVIPDEQESIPAAINNQGQVAGTSGDRAFRYTSSSKVPMEDVGRQAPKGTMSRGFGINQSGLVVGESHFGKNFTRAAVFSNGSVMDLGILTTGGKFSRANGINANGQIVGFSSEQPGLASGRAFIVNSFSRYGMTDLGTLGGAYAQAWGINDSGFVTGNSQTKSDPGATHAFIWERNAGMVDLGTLAGDFSYGMSINANNHVAGYSTIDKESDRVHAFLYDGETMLDLGSLSGASLDLDFSFALSVNSADQVVGYSYLPWGDASMDIPLGPWPVAFIYSEGVMLDLNELIGDAEKNYRLDCATAINDKGQIAAIAFDQAAHAFHAVLLTPLSGDSSVGAPGSRPRRMPPIVAPIPGAKPGPTPLGPPIANPGTGSRKK